MNWEMNFEDTGGLHAAGIPEEATLTIKRRWAMKFARR
jgi:hypothetical protein